jgi:hypothetical protein
MFLGLMEHVAGRRQPPEPRRIAPARYVGVAAKDVRRKQQDKQQR